MGNIVTAASELRQALDPVAFARERLGFVPDPWQACVLRSNSHRVALCCSRQAGKTTVTAVLALHTMIFRPRSLVLLFSKAQRQSSELLAKIAAYIASMEGAPRITKEAATELRVANGSRVLSLPGDGDSIRGFSAPDLIVEDEAAFVSDELYSAFLPMLAASRNGRLVLMSTPNGRRGHFFKVWSEGGEHWQRESVTAEQVQRITPSFLDEMRTELGPARFAQEFLCKFVEANEQLFSDAAISAAFSGSVPLLPLAF